MSTRQTAAAKKAATQKPDDAAEELEAVPLDTPPEPQPKPKRAETVTVHVAQPAAGPVHVDDGEPLCHPDTRTVPASPLVRAYLADGTLAEVSKETT